MKLLFNLPPLAAQKLSELLVELLVFAQGAGKQCLFKLPILQQDAQETSHLALRSGHGRQRGADQFWAHGIKLARGGVALKDGPSSHGGKKDGTKSSKGDQPTPVTHSEQVRVRCGLCWSHWLYSTYIEPGSVYRTTMFNFLHKKQLNFLELISYHTGSNDLTV